METALGLQLQNSVPPYSTSIDTYFPGNTNGPPPGTNGMNIQGIGGSDYIYTDGRDMGIRPNEMINHHYIMCPDLSPAESAASADAIKAIGVGMLLFARKHLVTLSDNRDGGRFQQTATILQSKEQTQFFEWTQLARWLANHSKRYVTAQEVLDEWKFAGGLRNEVMANTTATYGRRPHTRLMNATVRGPFTTFNIWGEKLISGQALFFIAKKGPVDGCFAAPRGSQQQRSEEELFPTKERRGGEERPAGETAFQMRGFDFYAYWKSDGDAQPPKRTRLAAGAKDKDKNEREVEDDVRRVNSYVWKIVPWTSKTKSRPDLVDLAYEDLAQENDGTWRVVTKVGAWAKIGVVNYSEGFVTAPDAFAPRGNSARLMRGEDFAGTIGLFNRGLLNNVEVFIGI
jgi:hypothetical protein